MVNLRPFPCKLLLLFLLYLSACTPRGQVTCPSFQSGRTSVSKRLRIDFSFLEGGQKRFPIQKKARQVTVFKPDELDLSAFDGHPGGEALLEVSSRSMRAESGADINMDPMTTKKYSILLRSSSAIKKQKNWKKKKINNIMNTPLLATKEKTKQPIHQERKTAITIGGALLLMAVLSGISIPVLGSVTASIGLVGIFLLDILVSFAISRYHKKYQPKLARTAGILRLTYTAVFGVGIGYHLAGNVVLFNKFWGIGLIVFGLHLIALGVLFHNEGGKKWVNVGIKSLLIIAGIGYIVQQVGVLLVANPVAYAALIQSIFIAPMILGEVLYALWMLFKGGKGKAPLIETN